MKNNTDIIISDSIEIKNMIYNIRGKQVMLDSDLASLYIKWKLKYLIRR